jgi:gamma-glutamyltranspeptidase / glutathione hydrolase
VVMAPGTGFLLNDEMDDFTIQAGHANLFGLVQGATNAIAPGKRPLSSMAPTLVMRDGRVFLVLGSPGGARIITITLETLLNVVDHGMALQEAVDAPRIHHQWLPDQIAAEPFALSPDTSALLTAMGYKIVEQPPWGASEAIEVVPPGEMRPGFFYGAIDARRPAGEAAGY